MLNSAGTDQASKKPEKGAKRRATQGRIIDAFERLLLRDGVSGLKINAIVAEAEVGKGLIYRYFGGLEGLAEAWMTRSELAPTKEQIAGCSLKEFQRLPATERLAQIHTNYATMLRNVPAACEVLAQDLSSAKTLPRLLQEVRHQLGKSHEELVTTDEEFANDEHMALIFVLQAAANYFALRANASATYNGIKLDTDEGWETAMGMLASVAKSGG